MTIRDEFKGKGLKFDLLGVPVEWCYFVEPDGKFKNPPVWKCTARIEETKAKAMKEVGFNIKYTPDLDKYKEGDDVYYFIEITTSTMINGKEMSPPLIYSHDGVTKIDGALVGNGSVMNLKVFARYIEVNGKTFLPLRLNSGQVISLVEYNPSGFKPVVEGDVPVADPTSLPF